ncbi:hypothetical protein LH425_15590, partial [Laribacter hongkongensis]
MRALAFTSRNESGYAMAADKRQQQQTQQPHQSASHRMPAHSMNRMTNNLSTSQISKLIKVMSGSPQRL